MGVTHVEARRIARQGMFQGKRAIQTYQFPYVLRLLSPVAQCRRVYLKTCDGVYRARRVHLLAMAAGCK